MEAHSPAKLVYLLIGKSIFEVLLVGGVSVAFYFATTNPYFRGWLDQADEKVVSGWAVDESNPGARVELQLFIDGNFIDDQIAAKWPRCISVHPLSCSGCSLDDYRGQLSRSCRRT